ncbi:unnamed protein product [Tilletia controversa]|uniref:Uncharacterized protein n=2 Tax=Tilletia TaxID=13289 RepID=A0A9N8LE24_9BASI|nr:hypothetical protein A4X03_0g7255 [Tilletia caries]CAD6906182.1 unnamed protein product [Tilletia controversa]CAD6907116.1 unnamed protein product [Tilletia laevis]CAD6929500.1 unnamed protein product [Tilletia controversa]CAD6958271.1 unnamed protein product [Tilletia controversa]
MLTAQVEILVQLDNLRNEQEFRDPGRIRLITATTHKYFDQGRTLLGGEFDVGGKGGGWLAPALPSASAPSSYEQSRLRISAKTRTVVIFHTDLMAGPSRD